MIVLLKKTKTNSMKKKIKSPCVSICRLNSEKICIGCGRTKKEIKNWSNYSNKKREKIITRLSNMDSNL